jgi:hypothetical protein
MARIDDIRPFTNPKPVFATIPVEEPNESVEAMPIVDERPNNADISVDEDEFDDNSEQPESDTTGTPGTTEGTVADAVHDEEAKLGDSETVTGGQDQEPPKPPNKFKRFFKAYWRKKKWTLPLTILVLLGIIFALPMTRYPLLALGLKRAYTVVVVDSKTNTPVTGARVTLGGTTVTTDNAGDAKFKVKVGKQVVSITKQYYSNANVNVFVGVSTAKNSDSVHLSATGRQVSIKVVNKFTGKPVDNAEVKVLDTEAKTSSDGTATIVLPTSSSTQSATISASGYNDLSSNVTVSSGVASSNTFDLVPAGRAYFLSNLSGKIDVVSTNLDGTDRTTVLGGTGNEDPNNTSLLASTDWKYLALLSKRDSSQNGKLYLIDTANNDQLTTIDGGSQDALTLVGWSGHNFIYEVNNGNVQNWQSGKTVIKSYDADNGKTTTIDQTSADGTQSAYEYQSVSSINLVNDKVIYSMTWGSLYNGGINASNQNAIISANTDGSSKTTLKSLSIAPNVTYTSILAVASRPGSLDILTNSGGGQDIFYTYNSGNNTVTQTNTLSDATFSQEQQAQVTYLVSPSGNATFWAEQRDGKNTLFVGDYAGNNSNQIASLSDYTTYGWYTDNYLLVEKGGSELYVMPVSGGTAYKISDYYKPPINYYGYGGGYGGL